MKPSLKARILRAIQDATAAAPDAFKADQIAEQILPTLSIQERDELARERIVGIISGSMRGPLHQPNSAQLPLPGFEDVPKFIRVRKQWINIRQATADDLTEFARWYRARVDKNRTRLERDKQILADVNRLAKIVIQYSMGKPETTVSEALELMNQKPKRLTPAERSEIAHKAAKDRWR